MGKLFTHGIFWHGGGSAAVWGNITGTLSDQTDLQGALNAKQDVLSGVVWYTHNTGTQVTVADTTNANVVKVYKNGLLLQENTSLETNDYSISGTTLTLTLPLDYTDKIAVEMY